MNNGMDIIVSCIIILIFLFLALSMVSSYKREAHRQKELIIKLERLDKALQELNTQLDNRLERTKLNADKHT